MVINLRGYLDKVDAEITNKGYIPYIDYLTDSIYAIPPVGDKTLILSRAEIEDNIWEDISSTRIANLKLEKPLLGSDTKPQTDLWQTVVDVCRG